MLLPLQAFLALQLKQQQLAAVAAAASASGTSGGEGSSSSDEAGTGGRGGGSNEVHQIDGLPPPVLYDVQQGSNHRQQKHLEMMEREREEGDGGEEGVEDNGGDEDEIHVCEGGSVLIFADGALAAASCQKGGGGGDGDGSGVVVFQSEGLVPDMPTLSIPYSGDACTSMNKNSPILSNTDDEHMNLDIPGAKAKEREQNELYVSSLEPQMPVVSLECKPSNNRAELESEGAAKFIPNLQKSKSQSHKKKSKSGKAAVFTNAEVIVQLDGPMGGGGQGSKVIVQLDGNGSSSEEDSDADDDSSEVSEQIPIHCPSTLD